MSTTTTNALAAPGPPLDHSELQRFIYMYAGERLAGCESAAIDERREAAHAIIRQIQDIELAAAAEIVDHTTTGTGAFAGANTAAQPADPPGDSPNLRIPTLLVSN